LAAAFNAPLAGVIFTVELVFGGAIGGNVGTMSVFIPLIVAAVAGTFTSHAIQGDQLVFDIAPHDAVSATELGFYVTMAALAGLLGSVMGRRIGDATTRSENARRPEWLKPAGGALGVGILGAIFSNELLGVEHSTVARALQGELAWQLALSRLGLKMVTTAL